MTTHYQCYTPNGRHLYTAVTYKILTEAALIKLLTDCYTDFDIPLRLQPVQHPEITYVLEDRDTLTSLLLMTGLTDEMRQPAQPADILYQLSNHGGRYHLQGHHRLSKQHVPAEPINTK